MKIEVNGRSLSLPDKAVEAAAKAAYAQACRIVGGECMAWDDLTESDRANQRQVLAAGVGAFLRVWL